MSKGTSTTEFCEYCSSSFRTGNLEKLNLIPVKCSLCRERPPFKYSEKLLGRICKNCKESGVGWLMLEIHNEEEHYSVNLT